MKTRNSKLTIALSIALSFASCTSSRNEPAESPVSAPEAGQRTFDSPSEAASALIRAAGDYDQRALLGILGRDAEDLIASADQVADKNRAAAFAAKAREKNHVVLESRNRATLVVGEEDWPLAIPIVESGGKWYFDSKAGREEMLRRRIGANELDAITVCRGFVEAQEQYASEVHDHSGVHQYAQRIVSTPGTHDGLAWQNPDGTWGGPVGETIAKAIEQGYSKRGAPFHGYYFKVLKGQGPSAPVGKLDYVVGDAMIGGFALLAWPAEYGVTGVQTFTVSWQGIVYQKDLGPNTAALAPQIERYDPDSTWKRTNDDW